ncbi:MAG: MBOAT family protein [Muribaculaceae bacterium]|nr:MBOAT family protein [Muribaculaceae bacterium]
MNMVSAALLTALSYSFFITYQPAGALILFAVTAVTYTFGLIMARRRERGRNSAWLIAAAVLIVAAPLVIFKYSGFISATVHSLLGLPAPEAADALTRLFIPLGISFFTFQSLGYMWDVYRGKISAEKNFLYYMLFVGFFPQIASGPISRADELLPQIRGGRSVGAEDLSEGVRLMLWGFFLKAVVADRVATFVNPVYADYQNFSGATCFLASLFYSIQIYGDFAGYSLIAIGVGRLFGFRLVNNFNRPYFSYSITDFWRRWHISLSRWLRDYVYIPLGGNRKGRGRTYTNILATFVVSGIWHGANLTFVVWGFLHGAVQAVEKFFGLNAEPKSKFAAALRITCTFLIANFAWIFFRMPTLRDACGVLGRIFTLAPGMPLPLSKTNTVLMAIAVVSLVVVEVLQEYFRKVSFLRHPRAAVRCVAIVALLVAIMTLGVLDAGQFIYVKF